MDGIFARGVRAPFVADFHGSSGDGNIVCTDDSGNMKDVRFLDIHLFSVILLLIKIPIYEHLLRKRRITTTVSSPISAHPSDKVTQ